MKTSAKVRKQIYRVYDSEGNKVAETECKQTLNYYKKQGLKLVGSGSFVWNIKF